MPLLIVIPFIAFATSLLSGVFGMAGGMVLMGALVLLLPVGAAFVTHGFIQIVANGWRAWLNRDAIVWPIIGWYVLASAATGAGFFLLLVEWQPDRALVFIALGLVGLSVWLPAKRFALDAQRPGHAFSSGVLVTGTNLVAGVAGPLLDIFFVRTSLSRHQIVATKALTQVFSHLAKILIYGSLLAMATDSASVPWLAILVAIPFSMLGTRAGKAILDRMSDAGFLSWTRWIVSAIGLVYLMRGLVLLGG